MTTVEYSMNDKVELDNFDVRIKSDALEEFMSNKKTHREEKVYKAKPTDIDIAIKLTEDSMVKEIIKKGGTILSVKSEKISNRRYKRKLAKAKRKEILKIKRSVT